MSYSSQSSVVSLNQKPTNVFYLWYSELCRRLNCNPVASVKPAKPKSPTILDFVTDRLKFEDWTPVVSALKSDTSLHAISIRSRIEKSQFLHDIDNEQKVRQLKRKCGLIWTAYILKSLLKSLTYTIRHNPVLSYLELDGIPLFEQYLEPLLKALKHNHTLRSLSLTRCKIDDIGCKLVCTYVKSAPNIEVLDLSWCGLTSESGNHIAKLIKYQQINRYCESWHNSLRYGDPTQIPMKGIKRITLNGNPFIGDEGLDYMLEELVDDLWIKALDMQKCGITEGISLKILATIEYNQTLEIFDFRNNEQLHMSTMQKIIRLLKDRQHNEEQEEFKWCDTAVTLSCPSNIDTASATATSNSTVRKTKSLPLKQRSSQIVTGQLRKTKTSDDMSKNNQNLIKYDEIEKKIRKLNLQLKEEITKRKETEKLNEELKKKLEEMNSKGIDDEMNNLLAKVAKKNENKKTDKLNDKVTENGYKYSANGIKHAPSSIFKAIMQNTENGEALMDNTNGDCYSDQCSSSQTSLYEYMDSLTSNNK